MAALQVSFGPGEFVEGYGQMLSWPCEKKQTSIIGDDASAPSRDEYNRVGE